MNTENQTTQSNLTVEEIQAKILHLLRIYPIISPTMLQGGLGPPLRSIEWRPVLNGLIEEGLIIEDQESLKTPAGRYNAYTKLYLKGTKVTISE